MIPGITVISFHKMNASVQVTLEYNNTSDPRKNVFDYAVSNGWTLMEMRASKRNLEDIFRHLTQDGDPAHA